VSSNAWILVAILVVLYVFSVLDRHTIAMIIDPVRKTLGIDDVTMSYLMGMSFALFYAAGGLPMGWLVDRYPRRLVLCLGIIGWGCAQSACGLAGSATQLFAARMFVGVGEASLMPAAHSMISDAFPKTRLATALSVYSTGALIGAGVSSIVGGVVVQALLKHSVINLPLLGAVHPWQAVFLATGLPGLVLALLIFAIPEPLRRNPTLLRAGARRRSMWPFLRTRWRLWVSFAMTFGSMNVAYGALIYWQPAYFSRFFHWTPAQYGLALGLNSAIAGTGGMLFSGAVIDRMFRKGLKDAHFVYYRWALIISTPLVIYALLSPNVWVFLSLIWIAQFATVNFLGFGSAAVQLTTPGELRGRMAALFTTVIVALLGATLGSSTPAWIAKYWLHDDVRLGNSIAATLVICVPIALAGIAVGRKPFREAVADVENGIDPTAASR
jgi:MFS family permease